MWLQAKTLRAAALLAIALGFGAVQSASASASASADINDSLQRAEAVKKYQSTLQGADKITAQVLIEDGLKSEDDQIAKIAAEFALGSKDKDFQTLAVKHWWAAKTNAIVRLISPSSPSDQMKAFLARTPVLNLTQMKLNPQGEPTAWGFSGSFINGGFNLIQGRGDCTVHMTDVTPKFIAGSYVCSNMEPIAARIDLE